MNEAALETLVKIGAPAVGPLCAALKDEKGAHKSAARALGRIGDARAVEPLASLIKEKTVSSVVREAAAEALAQIDDPRTLKPLTEFFRESFNLSYNSWVPKLVDNLLKIFDKKLHKEVIKEFYWISKGLWDHFVEMGPNASPLLYSVIKSAEAPDYIREGAAKAVGQADKEGGIELLIALLKNQDRHVRGAALYGLQQSAWEPGNDNERAAYFIANGEAARLKELDDIAIKPLLIDSMDWQMPPDDWYIKGCIAKLLVRYDPPPDPSILLRAEKELEHYAKKNAEWLDNMVQNPRPSDGRTTKRDRAMFQDYADLITAAASYKESSGGDGSGGRSYSYDTNSSLKAVKNLCKITTPVSTNLLHHLSRLKDITVTSRTFEVPYDHKHPSGMGSNTETLSFESQRSAAAKELARRGSPDYDLSVYKAEGCWSFPKE